MRALVPLLGMIRLRNEIGSSRGFLLLGERRY
jgi:hypothetical protein